MSSCAKCAVGYYSAVGATACTQCATGTSTTADGQSTCGNWFDTFTMFIINVLLKSDHNHVVAY